MNKQKTLLTLLLLTVFMSSHAQQLKPYEAFNVNKLAKVLSLNTTTKQEVKALNLERVNLLKTAKEAQEKNNINSKQYHQLLSKLTKEQRTNLFSAFEAPINKNKAYFSVLESFPKFYQKQLWKKLGKLEKKESYFRAFYFYEKDVLKDSVDVLIKERYEILNKEKSLYGKAVNNSLANNKCENLNINQTNLLRKYEFCVLLAKKSKKFQKKITQIVAQQSFQKLQKKIANCKSIGSIDYLGNYYHGQDSVTQKKILKKISKNYLKDLHNASQSGASLKIQKPSFKVQKVAKQTLDTQKAKRAIAKKENEKIQFLEKAQKAGLDTATTRKVLALIKERNEAIEAFKLSRKLGTDESLFALTEESEVKKPYVIKKEFAQNLTSILSYKQYVTIVGKDFRKWTKKQTDKEYALLVGEQKLNEEAAKELQKLVFNYYFHQKLTKSYYKYDKVLLKQKLGVLTYRFEKAYQIFAKKYNIKTGGSKKVDNRTFQWN